MFLRADINCVCTRPDDVTTRHNIPAHSMYYRFEKVESTSKFSRKNKSIFKVLRFVFFRIPLEITSFFRAIYILKGRDMLIMPGTGMISDSGDALFGFLFEIFKWTIAARVSRLKIRFVNVGIESIDYKLSKWFIKTALHLPDYCTYRDLQSRTRIANIVHNTKGENIFPDLAFSLPKASLPTPNEYVSKKVNYRSRFVWLLGQMSWIGDRKKSVSTVYW